LLVSRFILKELVPQFLSTLIVMTAILALSQIVRLSELLITFGFSVENVLLPFLFIVLPFLTFVIPIAFFFAVLVTIGRLTADGEYVALLAAGYSLKRVGLPVWIMAGCLYGFGATCASFLEPWGRRELVQFIYRKTQTQLDNLIRFKLQPVVFIEDFVGYTFYAERISADREDFHNVMLAPSRNAGQGQDFFVMAPHGRIAGSVEEGQLRLSLDNGKAYSHSREGEGSSVLKFKHTEIDLLRLFQDQIFGSDTKEDDFRSYPPFQLARYVDTLAADPQKDLKTYRRARFLLVQRLSIPFATISFALFGLVIAVQDQRRGKNRVFATGVASVVATYVVMMGFKWLGEEGKLPILVAAWLPNLLLASLGFFAVYQKNRLPISESIFAWRNLPLVRRIPEVES
jgi:lipopolysaccharide export system permease protein